MPYLIDHLLRKGTWILLSRSCGGIYILPVHQLVQQFVLDALLMRQYACLVLGFLLVS